MFSCLFCPITCKTRAALSSHVTSQHPGATFQRYFEGVLGPEKAPQREDRNAPFIDEDTIVVDSESISEDLGEAQVISDNANPVVLTPLKAAAVSKERYHPYKSQSDQIFAKLVREHNVRGSLGNDLLDLFKNDAFRKEELSFHSLDDIKRLQRSIPNRAKFKPFTITDGIAQHILWSRDIVAVAKELFGDPRFEEELALSFQLESFNGERAFGEFHTGDWFLEAQKFVGPSIVPIAVILYLDEKRVAIKNGKNVYPVYISIGNHSYSARQLKASKRLLAYLPSISGNPTRQRSLKMHQESLRVMVEPIKRNIFTWNEATDPKGQVRRVTILLAAVVCDWIEGAKVSMVLQMPSKAPCHTCYNPLSDFHNFERGRGAALRTEKESKRVVFHALSLAKLRKKAEGLKLCKEHSLQPRENCLWDIPQFDVHLNLGPDVLHVLDLGLFDWILKFVYEEIATLPNGKKIQASITERFASVPYFPGLVLFPNGVEKVAIENKGKFQGSEYRQIMRQIILVCADLLTPEAVDLLRAFLELYPLCKLPSHTHQTLGQLEEKAKRLFQKLDWFKEYSPSRLNFPKLHVLTHFRLFIEKFGRLGNLDTEAFEKFHHERAQIPYDQTNKQSETIIKQMVGYVEAQDNALYLESLLKEDDEIEEWSGSDNAASKRPTRLLNRGEKIGSHQSILNTYLKDLQSMPTLKQTLERISLPEFRVHTSAMIENKRVTAGFFRGRFLRSCVDFEQPAGMVYAQVLLLLSDEKGNETALVQLFQSDFRTLHPNHKRTRLIPIRKIQSFRFIKLEQIKRIVHIAPDPTQPPNSPYYLVNGYVDL